MIIRFVPYRRASVLLASLLLVASCGRRTNTGDVTPHSAPANLFVTNHYSEAMEVTAVTAGINHRLGVVSPEVERHFVLPAALLAAGGQIEFQATPSGTGPTARTGSLQIAPGDIVDFIITAQLFNSQAIVRNR